MSNKPNSPSPFHHQGQLATQPSKLADSLTRTSLTTPRTWGFRFSLTDAGVLVMFGAAIAILHRYDSSLPWIVAIVAGHFFLFCNVFRVVRRRELIWAAAFVVNVGFWLSLGRLDWSSVLACQLPISTGVIAWELKAARYHGVFADRLNARLPDYIEGRVP